MKENIFCKETPFIVEFYLVKKSVYIKFVEASKNKFNLDFFESFVFYSLIFCDFTSLFLFYCFMIKE